MLQDEDIPSMWKMVNVIINVSVKSFGKIVYLIQYVLTSIAEQVKQLGEDTKNTKGKPAEKKEN